MRPAERLLAFLEGRAAPAWLLLFLAALRSSGLTLGVLDFDETHFLVMARAVLEGAVPYVDVVDKKPPLTFLFYLPGALCGDRLLPVQLLGLLWTWATCLVVGRAAAAWTGRARDGAVAAWLYALVSSCGAIWISSELMLNLPAAGALLCFVRAERGGRLRHDLLAGLLVGVAALFRHQAGILLVALHGALLWQWARAGRGVQPLRHGALLLGFALPWAAAAGVYQALGHLGAFYEWNVARNFGYVGGAGSAGRLGRFLRTVTIFVLLGAPVPWALALRATLRPPEPIRVGLCLALWLTWIPVVMSGRFYSQYYLQLAPSLTLLAAPEAAALLARAAALRPAARWALGVGALLPVLVFNGAAVGRLFWPADPYPTRAPAAIEIAAWLRAHSRPDERIFVWGYYPPIYHMAGRRLGTRYPATATHVGDYDLGQLGPEVDPLGHLSARDLAATIDDLERRRTELVVDLAPSGLNHWERASLSRVPALWAYVQREYEEVGRPGGAIVYRRRAVR